MGKNAKYNDFLNDSSVNDDKRQDLELLMPAISKWCMEKKPRFIAATLLVLFEKGYLNNIRIIPFISAIESDADHGSIRTALLKFKHASKKQMSTSFLMAYTVTNSLIFHAENSITKT